MKVASIRAAVSLYVAFTEEEAANLIHAAEQHYDATCRTLPALKVIGESVRYGSVGRFDVRLDWHDLDVLSKICESPLASRSLSHAIWTAFSRLRHLTHIAEERVKAEPE